MGTCAIHCGNAGKARRAAAPVSGGAAMGLHVTHRPVPVIVPVGLQQGGYPPGEGGRCGDCYNNADRQQIGSKDLQRRNAVEKADGDPDQHRIEDQRQCERQVGVGSHVGVLSSSGCMLDQRNKVNAGSANYRNKYRQTPFPPEIFGEYRYGKGG